MKLDQIALVLVIIAVLTWLGVFATGMMQLMPYGLLGLIPVILLAGIMARIIYQKRQNTEDAYYEKNVDK